MTNKQIVVWNLVAFCAIYLILETALIVSTQSPNQIQSNNAGISTAWQYFISWWIIKPQIEKRDKRSLIKYTWIVSLSVYAVRLLLSFIFISLLAVA